MAAIIIVGDQTDWGTNLYDHFLSAGYEVLVCPGANEALSLIEKNKHFDLYVVSAQLPEMSGADFFNQVKALPRKENQKNPRFILIAHNLNLDAVQETYDFGMDEVLPQPINLDHLKLVVDYFFENQEAFGDPQENYFSIPTDDLLVSSHSNYSIFLKINGKYVCVTKTGQEFTTERLRNLKSKNIKFIYLNSRDYAKYTDLQFAIAQSIKRRPLDSAKRTKAFNHLISTISKNAFVNQIDKVTLDKALKAFENYTQMAFNNSQMKNLLETYTSEAPDLAERSSILATISSSIAHLWQWNSPKIQSRIVLGALLCDIGLKDFPHLLKKPRSTYTKEEIAEFEEHPLRSYKMLSTIEGLPDEVLQIALQHHENGVGHGFPQKLIRSRVHSFSKLVNGTNEFIEVLYSQKDTTNTQMALDRLFLHQRKMMSEQVLKSLYKIFNHEMPKELDGLLLPDESARVF